MRTLASWGLMGHLGTDLGSPWSILGSVLGTKNMASKTLFGNYIKNARTQQFQKKKRRPEASFLQRSPGKTHLPHRPFISCKLLGVLLGCPWDQKALQTLRFKADDGKRLWRLGVAIISLRIKERRVSACAKGGSFSGRTRGVFF